MEHVLICKRATENERAGSGGFDKKCIKTADGFYFKYIIIIKMFSGIHKLVVVVLKEHNLYAYVLMLSLIQLNRHTIESTLNSAQK